MFYSKSFKVEDHKILLKLIASNPLATVSAILDEAPHVIHIPLQVKKVNEDLFLIGHIAKVNPIWADREGDEIQVLTTFHGPNAYVSPSAYPSKKEDGRVVPTWNYAVVHGKGTMAFVEDRNWLLETIDQAAFQLEKKQSKPWAVSDAPMDYIDNLMTAIVGVKIKIDNLTGNFKLSQNKSDQDFYGVLESLHESDNPTDNLVAKYMVEHRK